MDSNFVWMMNNAIHVLNKLQLAGQELFWLSYFNLGEFYYKYNVKSHKSETKDI